MIEIVPGKNMLPLLAFIGDITGMTVNRDIAKVILLGQDHLMSQVEMCFKSRSQILVKMVAMKFLRRS